MGAMTVNGPLLLNSSRRPFLRTLRSGGSPDRHDRRRPIRSLASSGFCLVGLGICTRHSAGGGGPPRSSSMAPILAIAAVLTIGLLDVDRPPLIGFSPEAFGLRYAFGGVRGQAIGSFGRERYRGNSSVV